MSFSKVLIVLAIALFGAIAVVGYIKKQSKEKNTKSSKALIVNEKNDKKDLDLSKDKVKKISGDSSLSDEKNKHLNTKKLDSENKNNQVTVADQSNLLQPTASNIAPCQSLFPSVDRVNELFEVNSKKMSSIVETITYKAKVSWLPSRAAWIADYASHYATSRHFIARSLNGETDYLTQKVSEGDKFNVLRKDIDLKFHLIIDLSSCKMLFYALNNTTNEKILIKIYNVGLGRIDDQKLSGCLTPLGKYLLGSKVATYKPGSMGLFHGESVEMIKVFGTRWIPFDKELDGCSERAKGFGIHGVPWVENKSNQLSENLNCISKYESDGCIRLSTEDVEELFAIIITKPTTVEIVKTLKDSTLPLNEVK